MLNQNKLIELLDYDPVTGVFTRKKAIGHNTQVGDVAGTANKGYIDIYVNGTRYAAHQLAWLYVYGTWPRYPPDHKDRNGLNNAISNLREANKSQNGANRRKNSNNTSGYKGVFKHRKGYVAKIRVAHKMLHLGSFSDPVEAARAYDAAAINNFGAFAATNKSLGYI